VTRAAVQTSRINVQRIEGGVVRLAGPLYRAVLEVAGATVPMDDAARRESLLAGYAAFLNALSFPVQILVRTVPVDLSRYLGALEERARRELPQDLAALARDHAAFVQGLARQRTLLERQFYVVVPAQPPARGRWGGWRGWHPAAGNADAGEAQTAQRQLTFRCDEVARQLARCDLTVRRLDDVELATLFMACWSPERSRLQRFRQRLEHYTALVVGADGPPAAPQDGGL